MKSIKQRLTSQQKNKIKRWIRKTKSRIQFWVRPVTIEKMEFYLRDKLCIKEGDKIFVTSAFGSLNAAFSPNDLIQLLMKVVGEDGVIMMPYYPPGSSGEWAASGAIFDMQQTKSSMGVLTNVFSKFPGVIKSVHPTKAVCVWGKDAEAIAKGHVQCKSPYAAESPYGKFLKLHSKSVGLGAGKCPMGHCCEDLLNPSLSHYKKDVANLGIHQNHEVAYYPTLIHDMSKLKIVPVDYIKNSPDYRKVKIGYDYSYVIDNDKLFDFYKKEFAAGRSSLCEN